MPPQNQPDSLSPFFQVGHGSMTTRQRRSSHPGSANPSGERLPQSANYRRRLLSIRRSSSRARERPTKETGRLPRRPSGRKTKRDTTTDCSSQSSSYTSPRCFDKVPFWEKRYTKDVKLSIVSRGQTSGASGISLCQTSG